MTYVPLLSLLAAAFAVLAGAVVDPPDCSESDVNTLAQASNFSDGTIIGNVTTVNATCLTCINDDATNVVNCAELPPVTSCTAVGALTVTDSFYTGCYSGNNCSGFFDVLNEQSAECHYCESYSLLKDPLSVITLGNTADCVGPVANGTCPSNASVVEWEIPGTCSTNTNISCAAEFLAAGTSDSCAYCVIMAPTAPCFDNIPANQTCTDTAAVAPAMYCDNYSSGSFCPSALENLTDSCAECFAYEELVVGSDGVGAFETCVVPPIEDSCGTSEIVDYYDEVLNNCGNLSVLPFIDCITESIENGDCKNCMIYSNLDSVSGNMFEMCFADPGYGSCSEQQNTDMTARVEVDCSNATLTDREVQACIRGDILNFGNTIDCQGCLLYNINTDEDVITLDNFGSVTSSCGPAPSPPSTPTTPTTPTAPTTPTTPTAPVAAPSSPPASGASSISIASIQTSIAIVAVFFVVVN